jgi:uncharacterized protein (TIGR02099 family)
VPGLIRKLWRIAAGTFAVIVILLAVLVGLVRLALVQVPEYRDQVEAQAEAVLGWPVAIGEMDARMGLRGPELRFIDASVLTRDRERTLVRAATGSMKFHAVSLLRGRLRPSAVSLAGVALRIERDIEGRWRLLGEGGPSIRDGPPAFPQEGVEFPRLDALLQGRLQLEDVEVEYEDLRRGLGPWLFQVDMLDLQLGGGRLELAAAGKLPEALGSELELSLAFAGQDARGRPRHWSAGVSFTGLDLHAVSEAIKRPDVVPASGIVDGNLSARGDGAQFRRLAGDVLARDLRLPPAPGAASSSAALPYEHLGAAFEWTRSTAGWEVALSGLDVERAGKRWTSPVASLAVEADATGRRLEARADRVELEDVSPLAAWLPPAARTWVEQLAPRGVVKELEAHLDLPADEQRPPDLHVEAQFENVSLDPYERAPGLRNVTGTISGDFYGGSALLDARGAELALPWLFREPLVFEGAAASIEWTRNEQGFWLRAAQLALVNSDAAIDGEMMLEIPADGSSPRLELDAVARSLRLAAGPRYLPAGIMPPNVIRWLDAALLDGHIPEARVRLHGATREFPFRDGGGEFEAVFDIAGGVLDFAPGWPNATGIEAGIRFENEGLWAEVRAARLLALETRQIKAAIPDLGNGMLTIAGEARGELAAFRELALAADLLAKLLGPGLEPADFRAGRASAEVELSLPLAALAGARALVDLRIEDGVVAYGFLGEPLRDIDARIHIDNARVTAREAAATLAGWPVAADVVIADDDAIRIQAHGRMDGNALARVLRVPVDRWTTGEGEWSGHLRFPPPGEGGPLTMEIFSGLEGLAIGLPEPFSKSADESRSLRVRGAFPEPQLMDLEFEWDRSLLVAARVDRSGPEAVLGAVPGALEGDPPGLVFSGAIARLDLGAWLAAALPAEMAARGLKPAIAGGGLLVGNLSAPMIAMNDVLLELSPADDHWRLQLSAERASGSLEIPRALYGDHAIVARLDRLWLGAERDEIPSAGEAQAFRLHPASVPALDIEIDDFRFDDIRFGSISARVLHEGDGIELIGLEGIGDGFLIQAEGRSRLSDSVDESRLGLRISSEDVGATLAYMGFRRSMEAKDGYFEASVDWRGGLRSDWLSTIEGDAAILIRDGNLVNVAPGAGRVFGLLSIQALPRRLALDFKDVLGEGTAFDRISGDFRFAGGDAFTENLVMRGPAVDIGVAGRTGLVARDYDQTAVIGADLGRTLPVAGAVVGGPAVAAALYLLSEMLRKPFQAHVTYRLTGPWDNPVIEKLGMGGTGPQRSGAARGVPGAPAPEGREGDD